MNNRRRLVVGVAYTVGGIFAAGAFGAILGGIGHDFRLDRTAGESQLAVATSFALVFAALVDAGVVRMRLPTRKKQVPHGWRFLPPSISAMAYGAALGIGVGTPIVGAAFYVVLAGAVASASPLVGAVILVCFSVGRALPVDWLLLIRNPLRMQKKLGDLHSYRHMFYLGEGLLSAMFAGWLLGGLA